MRMMIRPTAFPQQHQRERKMAQDLLLSSRATSRQRFAHALQLVDCARLLVVIVDREDDAAVPQLFVEIHARHRLLHTVLPRFETVGRQVLSRRCDREPVLRSAGV